MTTWSACITRRRCARPPSVPCLTEPRPQTLSPLRSLYDWWQVTRYNAIIGERSRKMKAGEPLPPTVTEQLKSGEIKLPWTSAK
jgi:hypothetical protein